MIEITKTRVWLAIAQLVFSLMLCGVIIFLMCCLADCGCEWWQILVLSFALCYSCFKATMSVVYLAFVQYAKNIVNNGGRNS